MPRLPETRSPARAATAAGYTMTRTSRTAFAALTSLFLCAGARAGSATTLEEARRLAAAGDHRAAEAAYDGLLARQPGSVEALLGRAQVRSYRRAFAGAETDFQAVLAADPRSLPALVGLGYSLAWSGQLADSERVFRRGLEVAPGNPDAQKGLAYAALWGGQAPEAARRFEQAARNTPQSAELHTGLGQALEASGQRSAARAAFSRALELDPGRADARRGLEGLQGRGPAFDLSLLGSLTDTDGRRQPGLRFAEVGLSPSESSRAWLQYDDSLSLDNAGLARAGTRAPAFYAGGLVRYAEVHTTRLELGFRRLPAGVRQWLVRSEQVLALRGGAFLRAGAFAGPRSDDRLELVAHAGASLPLASWLRLEPTAFVGQSGFAGERDLRLLLAAQAEAPRGISLGAGVATGRSYRPAPAGDGTPWSAFASASVPLAGSFRARALVSREWPSGGTPLTMFALGFSAAFGGQP